MKCIGFKFFLLLVLPIFCFDMAACLAYRKPVSAQRLSSLDLSEMINRSIGSHSRSLIRLTTQHIIDAQKEDVAAQVISSRLESDVLSSGPRGPDIRAALEMYKQLPHADKAKIFSVLISSRQDETKKLAWSLAAELPSEGMAEAIKSTLAKIIGNAGVDKTLKITPEVALAIKKNRIIEAYSLVKTTLMGGGHPQHVRAMFELNRANASDDLLTYLAKPGNDEILEGRLQMVGHYTVVAILIGFKDNFPSLHHPDFPILFAYALSKDPDVSEAANVILGNILEAYPKEGALAILQLSEDIQNQYLQNLERSNGPLASSLFEDLRDRDPSFGH